MDGTTLLRFKQALCDQLAGRVANVVYASPVNAAELLGDDGSGVAVWFGDEHTADISVEIVGGSVRWWDERYTLRVIVQALGRDTDDDQTVIDQRTVETLGALFSAIEAAETAVSDDDHVQLFTANPSGWTNITGALNVLRAGRFEVDIEVHGRINV